MSDDPTVKRTLMVYEFSDGSYDVVTMTHPGRPEAMLRRYFAAAEPAAALVLDYLAPDTSFVPVTEEPDGARYVWVCNRCGQPLDKIAECRSGIHMGPEDIGTDNNIGRPVKSIDLAAKLEADRKCLAALQHVDPAPW